MDFKFNKTNYYKKHIARFGESVLDYLLPEHPPDMVPETVPDDLTLATDRLVNTASDTLAHVIWDPWPYVLPIPIDASPAQSVQSSSVATQKVPSPAITVVHL